MKRVEKREGRTRRSRATRKSTQAKHSQTNTWRELVATTPRPCSSSSTRPTSCTRTPWTTDVQVERTRNGGRPDERCSRRGGEEYGSGESLSTSFATASPLQHLIDLRYLLFLPDAIASCGTDGLASAIINLVVTINPPAPNPISARIINGIPGCDIAFGARCIYRNVTSRLGVRKRVREEGV